VPHSERKKNIYCNKVDVKFPCTEYYNSGHAFLQDIIRPDIKPAVEGMTLTEIHYIS
jgi:hypothetical protein